jgi:hypothetical protein
MGYPMSAAKIVVICILLWISLHLLLFGFLKRRLAAAKRDKDAEA